jgi:TetR/AcrR family transcriptional regulator
MEVERLSRREREKLSHRSQILSDALELFTKKGYHDVSMHEIARKAEFSIGTLYKYFKNKEDLYSALILDKAEVFFQTLDEVLSGKDDIENIVRSYIGIKISTMKDNLAFIRLLFAETRDVRFDAKTSFSKILREMHQKEIKKVALLLEKGIRSKIFRKVDPYNLSVALGGLINEFLFCWLEDPDGRPYEVDASFIAELFLKGCRVVEK